MATATNVETRTLALLLAINAAMFVVELVAGWVAQSAGLMADSLDMLADAGVYAVALHAVGSTTGCEPSSPTPPAFSTRPKPVLEWNWSPDGRSLLPIASDFFDFSIDLFRSHRTLRERPNHGQEMLRIPAAGLTEVDFD